MLKGNILGKVKCLGEEREQARMANLIESLRFQHEGNE